MVNAKRLQEASLNFGNRAVEIYDGCKNHRAALSMAEKLLNSSVLIGGYIEGIILNGDDGERISRAVNEIYKTRYIAQLLGRNKLCKDECVSDFIAAANSLLRALLGDGQKPEVGGSSKNRKARGKWGEYADDLKDLDPDGFEDVYIEKKNKKK